MLYPWGCGLWNKSTDTNASPLVFDGKALKKPGIFTDCTYGLNQSISDHAPVIYKNIATWNIASPARSTRIFIDKNSPGFFNHKFITKSDLNHANILGPEDGTLVDSRGHAVLEGEKSEVDRLTQLPNKHYEQRLRALAQKIKLLFKLYELKAMALQEIPESYTSRGPSLLKILSDELKPLVFIAPENYPGELRSPDVALVVSPSSALKAQLASKDLRAQAYCDFENKTCIVSIHIFGSQVFLDPAEKTGLTQEQAEEALTKKLAILCKKIEDFADKLQELKFKNIKFVGDFNVSAQNIVHTCQWRNAPILRSYEGEGSACSDNNGKLTEENIDILLEFK